MVKWTQVRCNRVPLQHLLGTSPEVVEVLPEQSASETVTKRQIDSSEARSAILQGLVGKLKNLTDLTSSCKLEGIQPRSTASTCFSMGVKL